MDKRFDEVFSFLWLLAGIFTTLTLGVIGFAYWDRRSIISKAKAETIEEIEQRGKLKVLIEALREYGKKQKRLGEILQQFNLF